VPRFAVQPAAPKLEEAVRAGGGRLTDIEVAEALIWSDPGDSEGLERALTANPDIGWVQLPYAGVEPFTHLFDGERTWTCGKGVYAEPVAEHALALMLAGLRNVAGYARRRSWSDPVGDNLLGARVTVVGGGEIARVLARLLAPFGAHLTAVRRHPDPVEGFGEVCGPDGLLDRLAGADVVVLALALTPETERIIDGDALAAMAGHTWLVNVARGRHVDTDALVEALTERRIGGAALDVTDPEPLPSDHPLWSLERCVITPHVGNTPEMGVRLLANRVRENVRRFVAGEELLGPVDVDLGY